MSETKHSPEPWWIDWEATKETMISAGAGNIAAVYSGEVSVGCRPDARRIVACVNACAGIETEALENGALAKALRAAELIELGLRDGDGREVTRARRLALVDALRALGRLP
jgi:hypothetical protein